MQFIHFQQIAKMTCETLATKAELEALRRQLANLSRIDEESIIRKAVERSKAALQPEISKKLDGSERPAILEDSVDLANSRYGLAMVPTLAPLAPVVGEILKWLLGILALSGSLARLEGLVKDLFNRINGLINKSDRLSTRISYAESDIDKLEDQYSSLNGRINRLEIKVDKNYQFLFQRLLAAYEFIEEKDRRTNKRIDTANLEIAKANSAAAIAYGTAINAQSDADAARGEAKTATSQSNKAITRANDAADRANSASRKALAAEEKADRAVADSRNALSKAESASRLAKIAEDKANIAAGKANKAIDLANKSIANSNSALSTASDAQRNTNQLSTDSRNGVITRRWEPKIWEPAGTEAVRRIQPEVNRLDNRLDTFDNVLARNRQENEKFIGEVYRFDSQLKTYRDQSERTFGKLPTFEEQLRTNRKTIDDFINQTSSASNTNINTQTIVRREMVDLKTRVKAVEDVNAQALPQLDRIENLLRNPSNTNTSANTNVVPKLGEFERKLDGLPAALAPALAAIIPPLLASSQTFKQAIVGASVEANCRSLDAGSCGSNYLGNKFQDLKNTIANNAGKVADQTNQAYQTILLTKIDAKLGDQLTGGLGGKLSRFVSWAAVDRIANLVTMFAALHNVSMLSKSVSSSFFGILDNLLGAGFNIAPGIFGNAEGQSIDSSAFVTRALDSRMSALLGAAEWTAIKAQWKAYSTIYNSTGQVFQNLREIHNDTQELCNKAKNYVAELGNALQDEGLISDDNWQYKDDKHIVKSSKLNKLTQGLTNLDNTLQAIEAVSATVKNITDTAKEIKDNVKEINDGITAANKAAKDDRSARVEGLELPNFSLEDLF